MMWAIPDTKVFLKGLLCSSIIIFLTIYLHSEYIEWSSISGSLKYLSLSYFIKNIIILITLFFLFIYLKKKKKKNYKKVIGEEKIYSKKTGDEYFDKFRKKDKLRTDAEQLLSKNEKE